VHAEVRTGRHGVVGAVERAEQAHRCEDQRTDHHTQHNRPDTGLKRQAEQHREAAEHSGGKRIGAAEDQAKQVAGSGVALMIRDLFDPVCFDAAKAFFVVVVIHDLLRSSGALIVRERHHWLRGWQPFRHCGQMFVTGQP